MAMGVDGIMTSPGYAYERAPDQAHFLTRQKTKQLFRDILKRGQGKGWKFTQSPLFMNFLAGNENYHCTPWGKPTRNVFGWQRPCYLLGEGYTKTFKELMDSTDWDKYGTGAYEKCADCMVHSGYESTAVMDAVASPLKTMRVALRGPKLDGDDGPRDRPDQPAPGRIRLQPPRAEQDGRTPPQEARQVTSRRRRRLTYLPNPLPPGEGVGSRPLAAAPLPNLASSAKVTGNPMKNLLLAATLLAVPAYAATTDILIGIDSKIALHRSGPDQRPARHRQAPGARRQQPRPSQDPRDARPREFAAGPPTNLQITPQRPPRRCWPTPSSTPPTAAIGR